MITRFKENISTFFIFSSQKIDSKKAFDFNFDIFCDKIYFKKKKKIKMWEHG